HRYEVKVHTEREWRLMKVAPKQVSHSGSMVINAPMPGLVKAVLVESGAEVDAGTRLVVLEAMKMENEITAPRAGRVSQVHVEAGSVVEAGKPLVTLE
ncbi:MAG TPA: acetyl-CoA carboxylase biotin carboxyl carrier protein subunit, partial [Chloroflexia bacterium]